MKTKITLLLLLATTMGFAQEKTPAFTTTAGVTLSTVPLAADKNNDSVYNNALSLSPFLSIRHKSGLGIIYSAHMAAGSGIYMHSLTAGYEQYDKPAANVVANYTHYFINTNSLLPYTPITNEVYTMYTYKRSAIRPVIAASVGFGQDSSSSTAYELAFAGGISHEFDFDTKGAITGLSLTPSLLLNAGTDGYYAFLQTARYISNSHKFITYTSKGGGKYKVSSTSHGNGRGNSGGSGSTTGGTTTTGTTSSTNNQFSINNLEVNMEGSLEMDHLTIRPIASIFMPLGSNTGTGIGGYWMVTVEYRF